MADRSKTGNRLLDSLPPREFGRLKPHLRSCSMMPGTELHQRTASSPYIYFPINSVSSLAVTLADGATIEVATVGNEGMVGLPLFIESESIAIQSFTQVPGEGLRMPRSVLRAELRREQALCHLLQEYTETRLLFVAQSCACNNLHGQRQRSARWLLLIHDRVGSDRFSLTQTFLAQMLGVRRATVTAAAGGLREGGLISYRRGIVQILNRKGLEKVACECYDAVRREFEALSRDTHS